ncbi:MAG: acylneuraminate cytidylyltransferase family protein [Glycocaulis sp.]
MSCHAYIPARAGSKGLPGKNIHPFAGRPLIAWTIEAARAAKGVDRVIVSTDGEDIARVAEAEGAEIAWRPAHLSGDTALPKDALRYHYLEMAEPDRPEIMVLLQPTSPLRRSSDIETCVSAVASGEWDSACTFKRADTNPYRAWKIEHEAVVTFIDGIDPWQPRQALPDAIELNGAVYAVRAKPFLDDPGPGFVIGRSKPVMMDEARSADIDTALDLLIAELIRDNLER